jgi:ribosomal protein S18 acetylase RimI-like enzyme
MQQSIKEEVDVHLRGAYPSDSENFASLFLISEPFYQLIFGDDIAGVIEKLFKRDDNLFSYRHVLVADFQGEAAGILLGYDCEMSEKEGQRTDVMLLNLSYLNDPDKLKVYRSFNNSLEKFSKDEFYVSNLAIYEKFRGLGIGKALMEMAEREAKKLGSKKIILDLGSENISATFFYAKLGFKMREEYCIPGSGGLDFCFSRMEKEI